MDPIDSEEATEMRSLDVEELDDVLDPDRMPVTTAEIVEEFGDLLIEYPRGSERLGDVLETSGQEEYETVDELQLAILNGVGRDAVGRPRYSDRGDERTHEFDRPEQSF